MSTNGLSFVKKKVYIMKIFAAIDIETTGLDVNKHEILSLAIVPLNNDFSISRIPEFTARIKAVHPEKSCKKALAINKLNPYIGDSLKTVEENILYWMQDNNISKITPVAHNVEFDIAFLYKYFPKLRKVFSHHGRDSMRLALTINDITMRESGKELFPSASLACVKEVLNVIGDVTHDAFEDAKDAAIVYRRLTEMLPQAY
jgi:DNA polymerase III epsilon subunit-like protein